MKNRKYAIILIVITLVVVEVISRVGLSLLEKRGLMPAKRVDALSEHQQGVIKLITEGTSSYFTHCPELGWAIKNNGIKGKYQANSAGIRSNREYDVVPPEGVQRISTFGDSFTHCDNVGNSQTWQAVVESFDSSLEMLNFGVAGYGLDQAYLRYMQKGRNYKADIVLIGFMTENIFRHVNTFRPFYSPETKMPFSKPRFHVESDELTLVPNILDKPEDYEKLLSEPDAIFTKLGEKDHYYNSNYLSSALDKISTLKLVRVLVNKVGYRLSGEKIVVNDSYNQKSEAFEVTKRILDKFYNQVLKDDAIPIIVLFPTKEDMLRNQRNPKRQYDPLLKHLEGKGYAYIDLLEVFEKNMEVTGTFHGHYSSPANRLVAEHIHKHLVELRKTL